MPYLFIMVGCPGSGKTTYVHNNIDIETDVHISRDAIRFDLLEENDKYFDKEKQVYRKFRTSIQKALNEGWNVYADATHINGISRYKLLSSLDINDKIKIVPVVISTSLEECLKRNSQREGRLRIPEKDLKRLYESFTDPANDKYNMIYKYDDIIYEDG